MTRLLLCEKPSQARDIARVLGANSKGDGCLRGASDVVTWCFGHLLEMAPPEGYGEQYKRWSLDTLPILPEAWRNGVKADARKQFKVIKELLGSAAEVVIATDADREGETIAREVLELCRWRGPTSRLWLSALDDASILAALSALKPGEQTRPLYLAGLGRARADWLVGMNLTRAYTVLGRERGHDGVLSVGRVQTPTLRLVVDRDLAIEAFRPVPYWDAGVTFDRDGTRFRAKWIPTESVSDTEGRCVSEQAARTVAQRITGLSGSVIMAETRRARELPPLPFDLGTLQQEADRLFGMGAQQVLDTAQALYETHKAVTYPRTDCPYLPQSMLAEVSAVLDAMVQSDRGVEPLVSGAARGLRSRAWDDGKITAHHAIIPTKSLCDMERMIEDERRLYDLIRRRYLAQFYPVHEYDKTSVSLAVAGEAFQASGRQVVAEGWRILFGKERDESGDDDAADQALPQLVKGTQCRVESADVLAKRTKPPARFTEGTLIAAMKNVAKEIADPRLKQILKETAGLGTEATRAGIIKTLLDRGFLRKQKKQLVSTETGRALIDALPAPVKDPGTTALWEQALDDIAQGRGNLDEFVRRQADWVRAMVDRARQGCELDSVAAQAHPCPECGKPLRRRRGKKGFFWGCSGYPDCQVTLPDEGGKLGHRRGEATGSCACGGEVYETSKAWQCKTCGATVWKESFGKKLTSKQALDLLAGRTVQLKGLKSNAGKMYDAPAVIEGGKLTLKFGQRVCGGNAQRTAHEEAPSTGASCPSCAKGKLVQRAMKSGKHEGRPFLGCTRFPTCRYFAWPKETGRSSRERD